MNARTTIMLEKPILERIRETARKNHQTLRETIRNLILAGLTRAPKSKATPFKLPVLNLGREKIDLSSRTRLYEMWDEEK